MAWMLLDEMSAVVELIDAMAPKLRGSAHAGQLAILRAQLLNLAREVQVAGGKAAPSDTAACSLVAE